MTWGASLDAFICDGETSVMKVDFGKTAADYASYRIGFPEAMFERLALRGIGIDGQHVLDLGTGTGTMARSFAKRGCRVVGLDSSEELLAEARRLDEQHDVQIEYVTGKAERTGLPKRSFDVVSAGQCWHWFDRKKAVREVGRVARPGGWLVIAHFDWLPLPNNLVEVTEQLIKRYNADWKLGGGNGLYPKWLRDARRAGFRELETFSFDVDVSFTHEQWRGRVRASAGVRASLSPDTVARFDERLRLTLLERFGEEPMPVPHCAWAASCRTPQ